MIKLCYKPVSIVVSVLGGMLAGAIFKRLWKMVAHQDEAPKATDAGYGRAEVLAAAEGTRKLTGVWPGNGGEHAKEAA